MMAWSTHSGQFYGKKELNYRPKPLPRSGLVQTHPYQHRIRTWSRSANLAGSLQHPLRTAQWVPLLAKLFEGVHAVQETELPSGTVVGAERLKILVAED